MKSLGFLARSARQVSMNFLTDLIRALTTLKTVRRTKVSGDDGSFALWATGSFDTHSFQFRKSTITLANEWRVEPRVHWSVWLESHLSPEWSAGWQGSVL